MSKIKKIYGQAYLLLGVNKAANALTIPFIVGEIGFVNCIPHRLVAWFDGDLFWLIASVVQLFIMNFVIGRDVFVRKCMELAKSMEDDERKAANIIVLLMIILPLSFCAFSVFVLP